jgi:hypothetical protein
MIPPAGHETARTARIIWENAGLTRGTRNRAGGAFSLKIQI